MGLFSCLIIFFSRNISFLHLLNVNVILILKLHISGLKHNSTQSFWQLMNSQGSCFSKSSQTWIGPCGHCHQSALVIIQAHRCPGLHDLFKTRNTQSPAASKPPCLGHWTSFKMDHYTSSLTPLDHCLRVLEPCVCSGGLGSREWEGTR